MRHPDVVTINQIKETLATETPGRWAKLITEDATWLVKKLKQKNILDQLKIKHKLNLNFDVPDSELTGLKALIVLAKKLE